jgi:two-component system, OmpR family, KDP operon response regulator KdpE
MTTTGTRRWLVRPTRTIMGEDGMQPERVRVLIVDDEPAICKALKVALDRAGYDAIAAQSGDSALTVLSLEPVDVLLLDLRIPDTRGDVVFELAAATHPHLRHQTLFMTGDISERAQRLIQACECPMILKPFELSEMIAAIDALLPRRRRDAGGKSA